MVVTSGEADIDLYPYNPSAIAAWAFLVLWGIGALVHFILMFPNRAAFPIPLIIGCIGMCPFTVRPFCKEQDSLLEQLRLAPTTSAHNPITTSAKSCPLFSKAFSSSPLRPSSPRQCTCPSVASFGHSKQKIIRSSRQSG